MKTTRQRRNWIRIRPALLALGILTLTLRAPAAPAAEGSASETVSTLHEALLEAMKAGTESGFDRRVEIIAPAVLRTIDLTMICRLVLGSHWPSLSQEDKNTFIDTFSRYVVADYAWEFDTFDGQRFETERERAQKPGVQIVSSTLFTKKGVEHRFEYQVRKVDERWLIVNIAVDGVSDLATKRAQYSSVIKKDGFAALLQTLENKILVFREGQDADA